MSFLSNIPFDIQKIIYLYEHNSVFLKVLKDIVKSRLKLWFNKSPDLWIPLIALTYHEVNINIDFKPLEKVLL